MTVDLDNPGDCHEWARMLEAVTKQRDAAERTAKVFADEARAVTAERDAYRAGLADLFATMVRGYAATDEARARARDLLKNGPDTNTTPHSCGRKETR